MTRKIPQVPVAAGAESVAEWRTNSDGDQWRRFDSTRRRLDHPASAAQTPHHTLDTQPADTGDPDAAGADADADQHPDTHHTSYADDQDGSGPRKLCRTDRAVHGFPKSVVLPSITWPPEMRSPPTE